MIGLWLTRCVAAVSSVERTINITTTTIRPSHTYVVYRSAKVVSLILGKKQDFYCVFSSSVTESGEGD